MKTKALLSSMTLAVALVPVAAWATEYVGQLKYGVTKGSYSTYTACQKAVKDEGGWCVFRPIEKR